MKTNGIVFQFKVTLLDIEPTIWRRFQVPASFNFWKLHVALQNVMGWGDSHLHVFRSPTLEAEGREIGMPIVLIDDEITVDADWDVPLKTHFQYPGNHMTYLYDFGDSWTHELLLEGLLLKEKKRKYPICLEGERACPPEDCGGQFGYRRLLEVLDDPLDEEYDGTMEWLEGHYNCEFPYDPNSFDRRKVKFESPKKRWEQVFLNDDFL